MADTIKKDTEYQVTTGYCDDCNSNRFFYRHNDGGDWFCQICGQTCNLDQEVKDGLETY